MERGEGPIYWRQDTRECREREVERQDKRVIERRHWTGNRDYKCHLELVRSPLQAGRHFKRVERCHIGRHLLMTLLGKRAVVFFIHKGYAASIPGCQPGPSYDSNIKGALASRAPNKPRYKPRNIGKNQIKVHIPNECYRMHWILLTGVRLGGPGTPWASFRLSGLHPREAV